jgi:hypothetical protein
MDIKSFGCSFIFGSELSDDGHSNLYTTGSRLTWPALLAKHLGYNYQTYARPGSGNLQIMEQILNQAVNTEPSLYIIGWTWIDRFDYVSKTADKWPADNGKSGSGWGTGWKTIMPADDTSVAKTYYQDLHSEYQDKLNTLISIRTAIDVLKSKNLPFIMTYMDDLMFNTQWHVSPAVLDLQNYIRPHMTCFDGQNFLEWGKKKGYPISTATHPLEEAHRAAADYIIKVFDKQSITAQVR